MVVGDTMSQLMRKTKIISTLGPSSYNEQTVKSLYSAGASVFRINCSHTSTFDLGLMIDSLRLWVPLAAIMVDIQGPKMRYSGIARAVNTGDVVVLSASDLGFNPQEVGVVAGDRLLVHDGRVEFSVTSVSEQSITCEAKSDGSLLPNKGVNLPDTSYKGLLLSDKDTADVLLAKSKDVEWLALSFIDRAADVLAIKNVSGPKMSILSKIERPMAITNLREICEVSDAVMVARGDLGVELPYYSIPKLQSIVAKVANSCGIPSVCATEMLESMIVSPRPTRAEVSDIVAAVNDGFDAIMLSGETAVGANPVMAVEVMATVASYAETDHVSETSFADTFPRKAAVVSAAVELAKRVSSKYLVSLTFTGYSAIMLAACNPSIPVIAITPDASAARKLQIVRGIYPFVVKRGKDFQNSIDITLAFLRTQSYLSKGDDIVICASRLSPRSTADTVWHHHEPV